MNCPCYSGLRFENCCGPIINNGNAETAEALMRSRYTAYTLEDEMYIHQTNHIATRSQYTLPEIKQWATENEWKKLEIIRVKEGSKAEDRGVVEFKAYYNNPFGEPKVHHEVSTFLKTENKWFFVSGELPEAKEKKPLKISRNEACPCGSGKKYKKCCA